MNSQLPNARQVKPRRASQTCPTNFQQPIESAPPEPMFPFEEHQLFFGNQTYVERPRFDSHASFGRPYQNYMPPIYVNAVPRNNAEIRTGSTFKGSQTQRCTERALNEQTIQPANCQNKDPPQRVGGRRQIDLDLPSLINQNSDSESESREERSSSGYGSDNEDRLLSEQVQKEESKEIIVVSQPAPRRIRTGNLIQKRSTEQTKWAFEEEQKKDCKLFDTPQFSLNLNADKFQEEFEEEAKRAEVTVPDKKTVPSRHNTGEVPFKKEEDLPQRLSMQQQSFTLGRQSSSTFKMSLKTKVGIMDRSLPLGSGSKQNSSESSISGLESPGRMAEAAKRKKKVGAVDTPKFQKPNKHVSRMFLKARATTSSAHNSAKRSSLKTSVISVGGSSIESPPQTAPSFFNRRAYIKEKHQVSQMWKESTRMVGSVGGALAALLDIFTGRMGNAFLSCTMAAALYREDWIADKISKVIMEPFRDTAVSHFRFLLVLFALEPKFGTASPLGWIDPLFAGGYAVGELTIENEWGSDWQTVRALMIGLKVGSLIISCGGSFCCLLQGILALALGYSLVLCMKSILLVETRRAQFFENRMKKPSRILTRGKDDYVSMLSEAFKITSERKDNPLTQLPSPQQLMLMKKPPSQTSMVDITAGPITPVAEDSSSPEKECSPLAMAYNQDHKGRLDLFNVAQLPVSKKASYETIPQDSKESSSSSMESEPSKAGELAVPPRVTERSKETEQSSNKSQAEADNKIDSFKFSRPCPTSMFEDLNMVAKKPARQRTDKQIRFNPIPTTIPQPSDFMMTSQVTVSDHDTGSQVKRMSCPSQSSPIQPNKTVNSPKQSSQFWSHYNTAQRLAVQDAMLNCLGQCVMICKIRNVEIPYRQPSFSKTEQFSESFLHKQKNKRWSHGKSTNLPAKRERKIKIDVISAVSDFFQKLPHYQHFNYLFRNALHRSSSGSRTLKIPKPHEQSHSIIIKNNLKTFSNDIVSRHSFKNSSVKPSQKVNDASISWQEDEISDMSPKNSIQISLSKQTPQTNMVQTVQASNSTKDKMIGQQSSIQNRISLSGVSFGEMERELLELKIFQPYYMSKRMVLQFPQQQSVRMTTKLSIMDILEQYHTQKNTHSRLFFRVNLNEDIQHTFSTKEVAKRPKSEKLLLFNHSFSTNQNDNQTQKGQCDSMKTPEKKHQPQQQNTQRKSGQTEDIGFQTTNQMVVGALASNQSYNFRNLIDKIVKEVDEISEKLSEDKEQPNPKSSPNSQNTSEFSLAKRKSKTSPNLPSSSNNAPSNCMSVIEMPESSSSESLSEVNSRGMKEDHIIPRKRHSHVSKGETDSLNSLDVSDSLSSREGADHPVLGSLINKSIATSHQSKMSLHYSRSHENSSLINQDERIQYFEFEMKQIESISSVKDKGLTFFNIKDITQLVQNQQKLSDFIYQEAIENNYSHEQMTPLNCILNFSALAKKVLQDVNGGRTMVKHHLKDLHHQLQRVSTAGLPFEMVHDLSRLYDQIDRALKLIVPIEQSAQSMQFYSSCQIARMQISNKQLNLVHSGQHDVLNSVRHALWPFEMPIGKKRINVYALVRMNTNFEMFTDWNLYELILFNIIQNAIKFNVPDGDIVIILNCKKRKVQNRPASIEDYSMLSGITMNQPPAEENVFTEGEPYILETEIIDSGQGISSEQQKMLFIPFLELKNQQGIMRAKHDNIGLGLSSSRDITLKMGGDIRLKQSEKGFTVITFRIPVQIMNNPIKFTGSPNATEQVPTMFTPKRVFSGALSQGGKNPQQPQGFDLILYGRPRLLKPLVARYLKFNNYMRGVDYLVAAPPDLQQEDSSPMQRSQQLSQQFSLAFNVEASRKISEKTANYGSLLSRDKPDVGFSDLIKLLPPQIPQNPGSTFLESSSNDKKRVSSLIFGPKQSAPISIAKLQLESSRSGTRRKSQRQSIDYEASESAMSESLSYHSQILQGNNSRQVSLPRFSEIKELQVEEDGRSSRGSDLFDNLLLKRDKISKYIAAVIRVAARAKKRPVRRVFKLLRKKKQLGKKQKLWQLSLPRTPSSSHSPVFRNNRRIKSDLARSLLTLQPPVKKLVSMEFPQNQLVAISKKLSSRPASPPRTVYMAKPNQSENISLVKNHLREKKSLDLGLSAEEKRSVVFEVVANNHRHRLHSLCSQRPQAKAVRSPSPVREDEPIMDVLLGKAHNQKMKQEIERRLGCSDSFSRFESDGWSSGSSIDYFMSPGVQSPRSPRSPGLVAARSPRKTATAGTFRLNLKDPQIDDSVAESDEDWEYLSNDSSGENKASRTPRSPMQARSLSVPKKNKHIFFTGKPSEEEKKSETHDKARHAHLGKEPVVRNSLPPRRLEIRAQPSFGPTRILSPSPTKKCDCHNKILLVDDTLFNVFTLSNLLQEHFDITPDEAENGQVAIDKFRAGVNKTCGCRERAYRLILMDIQMPIMDGYEATQSILRIQRTATGLKEKKRDSSKEIKSQRQVNNRLSSSRVIRSMASNRFEDDLDQCHIVAVTAYSSAGVKQKCIDLGMKDVVAKPVSVLHLKEVMYRHFFRYSEEECLRLLEVDKVKMNMRGKRF